jgi:rubredoxin
MVPVMVVQQGRPDNEGVRAWNCPFCNDTQQVEDDGNPQWEAVSQSRRASPPVIRVPAPKEEPAESEPEQASQPKPAPEEEPEATDKPKQKIPQNADDVRKMIEGDPRLQKSAASLAALIKQVVPDPEPEIQTQPAQWVCPSCGAENALDGPVAGVQSVTCVCEAEAEIAVLAREPEPTPMTLLCTACDGGSFDVARVDLPTADDPSVTVRCPECEAGHGLTFADGKISWQPPSVSA